jgi:hypothetical protein
MCTVVERAYLVRTARLYFYYCGIWVRIASCLDRLAHPDGKVALVLDKGVDGCLSDLEDVGGCRGCVSECGEESNTGWDV